MREDTTEILEPVRRQRRVDGRTGDRPMTQLSLGRPGRGPTIVVGAPSFVIACAAKASRTSLAGRLALQPIGVWRALLPTHGAAWAELVPAPSLCATVQEFDAL
jgi:hypothetical protein